MDFVYDPSQIDEEQPKLQLGETFLETPEGSPQTSAKTTTPKKKGTKTLNTYFQLEASQFDLRTKKYLTDGIKKPSKDAAFELVNITVIRSPERVYNVAENLASLKEFLSNFPDEFFIIVIRLVPTKPLTVTITISRRVLPKGVDAEFDLVLDSYLNGDDNYKNIRLKYIAKLAKAPWAVLGVVKALGGEKPVILGKGYLDQQHYAGKNYYELDVDAGSSVVARQICNSVARYSNLFRISECFVIEGKKEEELPERVLFCNCFEQVDLKTCAYTITNEDKQFFVDHPYQPV